MSTPPTKRDTTHTEDDVFGYSDEELVDQEVRESLGASAKDFARTSPVRRAIFEFMYRPATELSIFVLVVISVIFLVIEVSLPPSGDVSWLLGLDAMKVKVWLRLLDISITSIFVVEYLIKFWLAPRKWFFIKANWVDLLAILPILRVFRIGRAMRLLRLLKLLRLIRVGRVVSQQLTNLSGEVQKRLVENVIIFVYLLFSLVFGSVGILVFEKGHKSGFESLGDGLWWCVVTLTTVGYGDKFPVTLGGKVVAAVIMFIGLSFYALLTGVLSTLLIERSRRAEQQGLDLINLVDHVVICNWNDNGFALIRDLRQNEPRRPIVIVYSDDSIPQLLDSNVFYIFRDPTTDEALERARLNMASVAVILSPYMGDRSAQDADARSILTTLAVEKRSPKVHSIVEIFNAENEFHAQNAGADEVIISSAYTGTMLSQAVQSPGICDVYNDILATASHLTVREHPIDRAHEGAVFEDVYASLYASRKITCIGYRRGEELILSPPPGAMLQKEDLLVSIGRAEPK